MRDDAIAKIAAGESLEQAELAGIDRRGVNLHAADFRKANLSQAKLKCHLSE